MTDAALASPTRGWRTWREAMAEALYGDQGFYRSTGAPARHFRTAAHATEAWADAVQRLADRVDDALGRPAGFTVVDVGAGGGELLTALAEGAPGRWRLVGVDVAPRPDALPTRVEWLGQAPEVIDGVLLAVELLDVVPVDVVEATAEGPRIVEVDNMGRERLGSPPSAADRDWLRRWWPVAEDGDRAEIGAGRDATWADLVGRIRAGMAVAVDYAAVPARDVAGTLTGYRDGRQTLPVPDRSMDLTAHVLLESCADVTAADQVLLTTQREALLGLGLAAKRPTYDGDPPAYLARLSSIGDIAELIDPAGLGGFTWLVATRGVPLPW